MSERKTLMTEGPIYQKIAKFALPIFLGHMFQQLYAMIDSLVVGNFVGPEALAAVGATSNLVFLLTGFVIGAFQGGGVVISSFIGAEDPEGTQKAVHTQIALAIVAGLLLTVIGILCSPTLLRWMNVPEDVMPLSLDYLNLYFLGIIMNCLFNATNGIFNASGDSRHPLYYLIISSVVNIVLDVFFVTVLNMSVKGVAIATVLSQGLSAALGIRRLMRSNTDWRIVPKKIHLHGYLLARILKIGIPNGLSVSIISIANMIMQSHINIFGPSVMAGNSAFQKIEGFAFLPINSFTAAASTFVSQNLGAQKYDRIKKGSLFCAICCVGVGELLGLLFYLFCPQLISLFGKDPDMIQAGVTQARILTIFWFLLTATHSMSGILQGAGKTAIPSAICIFFWCGIRVSYVTIATRYVNTIETVYSAFPLTWLMSTVILGIYMIYCIKKGVFRTSPVAKAAES